MSLIRVRIERSQSAKTDLHALERGMDRGDLKGVVAGKSLRMKPTEAECFAPDFLIFQKACCTSQDAETPGDRVEVEFYGKIVRSVKTNMTNGLFL